MAKKKKTETEAHRGRAWKSRRKQQTEDSDIGTPPEIVNVERRTKAKHSLLFHLLTYQGDHFPIPFSDVHSEMISALQNTALNGGTDLYILPRGSGKSTILLYTVLWVALHGIRFFPFLSPGDGEAAPEMMEALRLELLTNELLLEDFPEVCYPMVLSEGIANRANYQKSRGEPTGLKLGKYIRFPMMPENLARGNAGVVIKAKGFLGAVRGKVMHLPGRTVRPDFYLIDDPQTLQSAYSETETNKRRKIIKADLLRGGGPNVKPAAVGLATIIKTGDLAHQMCDPKQFPGWHVVRVSFLQKWPERMDLWARYGDLRRPAIEECRDPEVANEFYRENYEEMRRGAAVYWPDRIDPGSIDSIQTAMNRWIDDPITFASEDQNEPIEEGIEDADESLKIEPEDVEACISHIKRGVAPSDATHVVSFVDVSGKALWWMTCAISPGFKIHVMDYGSFPDNGQASLAEIKNTLRKSYGGSLDEALIHGITDLVNTITEREYRNEAGDIVPFSAGFVDSKWGQKTRLVRVTLWKGDHPSIWLPYEGVGVRAASNALNDIKAAPIAREIRGHHWRQMPEKEGLRVLADSNMWKSFVAQRIKEKAVTIFAGHTTEHRMLVNQWTAEYPKRVERAKRKVDEWMKKPGRHDEHLWDCVYGIAVRASMLGISLDGLTPVVAKAVRQRVSFREVRGR